MKRTNPDDVLGVSALVVQGVGAVTDLVEALHSTILNGLGLNRSAKEERTSGITGFVYRRIHNVTDVVGFGLDKALKPIAANLKLKAASRYREPAVAALNGVLGDSLVAAKNPLAITMTLRQKGESIALHSKALAAIEPLSGKVLVLVHGLCMNDLQWLQDGHDHGQAIANALGYTPLYLHYNSGLSISDNGQQFSKLLEQVVTHWPVPLTGLTIIGHSMGGLVARSACQWAALTDCLWLSTLKNLIFLGSPHLGAPLERMGRKLDYALSISPYSAPFARLGLVRSVGIQNLRDGKIADRIFLEQYGKEVLALPKDVKCYAIAASKQATSNETTSLARKSYPRGDGLVPVRSALGESVKAIHSLGLPPRHKKIVYGVDHFQLLSSAAVYAHIQKWLR